MGDSSPSQRGVALGASAYLMWGIFPLYFPLMAPAGALEVLAHRVIWSCVTMGVVAVALGRRATLRAALADRRTRLLVVLAAATITVNWATYIYGVTSGRVVETALGYFVNPLVTVLLGVVVLGERLRRAQWWAVGIAGLAVVVLTVDYGHPPYVSVLLACSFGAYGLAKKTVRIGAVESLTLETAAVAPVALTYLLVLAASGGSTFTGHGVGHSLLLVSTGLATAVPLLCFGAAAGRVSLVTLGLLQYIAPVLQFLLGVLWFHEAMPPGRWAGFVLVWVALVVLSAEATHHHRSSRRAELLATQAAAAH